MKTLFSSSVLCVAAGALGLLLGLPSCNAVGSLRLPANVTGSASVVGRDGSKSGLDVRGGAAAGYVRHASGAELRYQFTPAPSGK